MMKYFLQAFEHAILALILPIKRSENLEQINLQLQFKATYSSTRLELCAIISITQLLNPIPADIPAGFPKLDTLWHGWSSD
jgi:hypothetical protein